MTAKRKQQKSFNFYGILAFDASLSAQLSQRNETGGLKIVKREFDLIRGLCDSEIDLNIFVLF